MAEVVQAPAVKELAGFSRETLVRLAKEFARAGHSLQSDAAGANESIDCSVGAILN
jgi:hypothetical protein